LVAPFLISGTFSGGFIMGTRRIAKMQQARFLNRTRQDEGDKARKKWGACCKYCNTWSEKVKNDQVYICEECYPNASNARKKQ
jgi:hypothetical protein